MKIMDKKAFQPAEFLDIPTEDVCSWAFSRTHENLDKPVYIDATDPEKYLTYSTALQSVRQLVAGLRAIGLKPQDVVCLHAFNNIYYAVLFFGIIGARGTFVGSNPAYTAYELDHLLEITATKFVIVESALVDKIIPSARKRGIPDANIFVLDLDGHRNCGERSYWINLIEFGEQDWFRFDDKKTQKDTPAVLALTSGTTGLPKAAILSHRHFVAANVMSHDSSGKDYEIRRLYCIPQFHAFAIPMTHIPPLKDGFTTYLMKRFDLRAYVAHLRRYAITETAVVTPIVLTLLSLSEEDKKSLRTLRFITSGGAPLDASQQNAICALAAEPAVFGQVWGLTEMSWATFMKYPEKDEEGSVGRLLPNTEARIIDEYGLEITRERQQGELLVRSPTLMSGYLNNPEATKDVLVDGWLHTGDIGYCHNGKWFIVDRKKDLIKVRAWQVSPAELEQCLLQHPAIHDAAVIGVDFTDGRGELPRAYIVLQDRANNPHDDEIIEFMVQRMASYKRLAGGIVRIEKIPRNQSGKIVKLVLRERAAREMVDHLGSIATGH